MTILIVGGIHYSTPITLKTTFRQMDKVTLLLIEKQRPGDSIRAWGDSIRAWGVGMFEAACRVPKSRRKYAREDTPKQWYFLHYLLFKDFFSKTNYLRDNLFINRMFGVGDRHDLFSKRGVFLIFDLYPVFYLMSCLVLVWGYLLVQSYYFS